PAPAAPHPAPARAAAAAPGLRIDLHNFAVNDATLTLHDAAKGTDLSITHINVATAVSTAADAITVTSLALRADLPGAQRVSVNGTGLSFNLTTHELGLGDVNADIPGGVVTFAGAVNVNTPAGDVAVASDGLNLNDVAALAAAFVPPAAGADV